MIKTIVSIERMMNKDSEMEKFSFEASLMKRPVEMQMNYTQLARFVFVQSIKIYFTVLLSSCFAIFMIVFIIYPSRKLKQLHQTFKNRKLKNKRYEYINC